MYDRKCFIFRLRFADCFVGLTTLGKDMTYKHTTRQLERAFDRVGDKLAHAYSTKAATHEILSDKSPNGLNKAFSCTCELMVHPGYKTQVDNSMSQTDLIALAGCGMGPDEFDQSLEREHEMNVICGRLMRDWFKEKRIEIIRNIDS